MIVPQMPPGNADGVLMRSMRSEEGEAAAEASDDADAMRDERSPVGRGKWLALLLGMLGIVALVLLYVWILGFL
jgi:hypothetical protein